MNVRRIYNELIDLHFAENRQMVFLTGPRQVGKTTTALFAGSGNYEVVPEKSMFPFTEEYQREAFEILKQLQYSESEALELVRRTCGTCPDITTVDEFIQEIFKQTKRWDFLLTNSEKT